MKTYLIYRLRILVILAIFYVLHEYTMPVFGWIWVLFFLFGDISDHHEDTKLLMEEKESWRNFLIRREHF
jgi:hypothetical protein